MYTQKGANEQMLKTVRHKSIERINTRTYLKKPIQIYIYKNRQMKAQTDKKKLCNHVYNMIFFTFFINSCQPPLPFLQYSPYTESCNQLALGVFQIFTILIQSLIRPWYTIILKPKKVLFNILYFFCMKNSIWPHCAPPPSPI